MPIIVVPSASMSLLTLYNIKKFLEDGAYVPSETAKAQMKGLIAKLVMTQRSGELSSTIFLVAIVAIVDQGGSDTRVAAHSWKDGSL